MKLAASTCGAAAIAIGLIGLVSPASLTELRRLYFATPIALYTACAIRFAMGWIVISVSRSSRWPWLLRAIGAVACLQAVSAAVMGPQRASSVLAFEAAQSAWPLRFGAAISVALGSVVIRAVRFPTIP